MFYSSAWCTDTEQKFKENLPLDLLAKSIRRFNSHIGFTIVMLEGIDKLSNQFLEELQRAGFTMIDYTTQFKNIVSRFSNIDNFFSRYERNCFLRWIAFEEILQDRANPSEQFWHLDIDVVMHTSLDELAEDTRGKTFMLQGCPVFVSVANYEWFQSYKQNLTEFNKDISGYSNIASTLKGACAKNDLKLANQSLFRNPIGSDQDLLEFLVSSQRIPQEESTKIFDSKFYFIQNPLSLPIWHELQQGAGNLFRGRSDGQITINLKSVPFVHYQNTFVLYASVYLKLKQFGIPNALIKKIMKFDIRDEQFRTNIIFKAVAKLSTLSKLHKGRNTVVRKLSNGNKTDRIAALLNFLLAQDE